MQEAINTYIKFVPFQEFNLWDVKNYTLELLQSDYPFIELNEILYLEKMEWVEIEKDKEYPILGVRAQGKGVYINRIAKGSELNMKKYQKSKANYLFYCKVRTVNGQWGIVYPEFENSFGSSNMQYLKVDSGKVNFKYLELLLSIKKLTNSFDKNAIGADGRHFTLSTLLSLKIPLPTLAQQQKIVDAYTTKIQQAQALQTQANNLEEEIEKYLFDALGVKFNANLNRTSLLQYISFESTNRWDSLFLLGKIPSLTSKFNIVKFTDSIQYFNKDESKSIRIDSTKYPNDDFKYIGMEHIEKETGTLLDMPVVKGKEIKSQTLNIPKGFFIYGKLRPYLNKYWVNETDYNNIICSSEFFVFKIKEDINKDYFKFILSSKIIQNQIADKTSGARMPRINEDIFYDLQFPLPPIKEQNLIANNIKNIKQNILKNKEQLLAMIQVAQQEFEKQIFG